MSIHPLWKLYQPWYEYEGCNQVPSSQFSFWLKRSKYRKFENSKLQDSLRLFHSWSQLSRRCLCRQYLPLVWKIVNSDQLSWCDWRKV